MFQTIYGKQYANILDTANDLVQSCYAHYLSLFLCLYFIRWTELIKDVVLHTVEHTVFLINIRHWPYILHGMQ